MTTKTVTTEDLTTVIRDAHERGWTVGQIANTLIDWLETLAEQTLTLEEIGDMDARRITRDRIIDIADEIRDATTVERMTEDLA